MKGKWIQFNSRRMISLLIAVLLLATTAIPALAWSDEGTRGQLTPSCRAIWNGEELHLISCGQQTSQQPTLPVALERPPIAPGVARAEKLFLRYQQPIQLLVKN